MGFENIRRHYENRRSEQNFSTSSQSEPSFDGEELFGLIVQAFLWAFVFIIESFKFIWEIIEELWDEPQAFFKYSYVAGGFFYAFLYVASEIEELFLHFSIGDFFNLIFKIIFINIFWILDLLAITKIPWIVFVGGILVAYSIQKRRYDTLPIIFWIWSIIAAVVYILFFIKLM